MLSGWFTGATPDDPEQQGEDAGAVDPQEHSQTDERPALNLWSIAAALTSTVTSRATEIVKSVQETDWKSELSQFSKEVSEDTKTLTHTAAEAVENFPHAAETVMPASSEVSHNLAGMAGSLTSFGKSLLVGTKEIIEQVRDGMESEIAAATKEQRRRLRPEKTGRTNLGTIQGKYSRFESEVAAMQRDSSTYCDEPDDVAEYAAWRAGFSLEAAAPDVAKLTSENAFMAELQSRIVPIIVSYDDFWHRYFYRLHKLQAKEDQRQQLTQRARALQEGGDEDLGWGDDDDTPHPKEDEPSTAAAAGSVLTAAVPSVQAEEQPQVSSSLTTEAPEDASTPAKATAASEPVPEATVSSPGAERALANEVRKPSGAAASGAASAAAPVKAGTAPAVVAATPSAAAAVMAAPAAVETTVAELGELDGWEDEEVLASSPEADHQQATSAVTATAAAPATAADVRSSTTGSNSRVAAAAAAAAAVDDDAEIGWDDEDVAETPVAGGGLQGGAAGAAGPLNSPVEGSRSKAVGSTSSEHQGSEASSDLGSRGEWCVVTPESEPHALTTPENNSGSSGGASLT